jgi:hypothetical protein
MRVGVALIGVLVLLSIVRQGSCVIEDISFSGSYRAVLFGKFEFLDGGTLQLNITSDVRCL